jgi:hypothetical protein
MNQVGAGLFERVNFFAEPGEVSGQNRRRYFVGGIHL